MFNPERGFQEPEGKLSEEEELNKKIKELEKRKNQLREEREEKEIKEKEDEKTKRRNEILAALGEGITMERHSGERSGERVSIYKDEKYLGDIVSDDNMIRFMPDNEFQDKVYELLYEGSETKENGPRIEANIDEEAAEVMTRSGITLGSEKLTLRYHEDGLDIDLYNNGENQSIDIEKIDEKRLLLRVVEKSGKIIEYIIDNGVFVPDSRIVKPPKK